MILFASSSQVYRLKNRVAKISEASALKPESIYGVSKKTAEDLIRITGQNMRIKNTIRPLDIHEVCGEVFIRER